MTTTPKTTEEIVAELTEGPKFLSASQQQYTEDLIRSAVEKAREGYVNLAESIEVHQVTYMDYDIYEIDSTWLSKDLAEACAQELNDEGVGRHLYEVMTFLTQDPCVLVAHDFSNEYIGGVFCSRCRIPQEERA